MVNCVVSALREEQKKRERSELNFLHPALCNEKNPRVEKNVLTKTLICGISSKPMKSALNLTYFNFSLLEFKMKSLVIRLSLKLVLSVGGRDKSIEAFIALSFFISFYVVIDARIITHTMVCFFYIVKLFIDNAIYDTIIYLLNVIFT